MPWAKLDERSYDHPKVDEAGNAAWGLVCRMICWSSNHLTDGFVPDRTVARLGRKREQSVAEKVGLIARGTHAMPHDIRARPGTLGTGYWVHDYLDHNPTAEQVERDREAARERQRRGRDSQAMSRRDITVTNGVTHGVTSVVPTRPDPTRPVVTNKDDNSKSVRAEPGSSSSSFDATLTLIAAACALARGNTTPGYTRGIRRNVTDEHGDEIRRQLANGNTPTEIAATFADPVYVRLAQENQP